MARRRRALPLSPGTAKPLNRAASARAACRAAGFAPRSRFARLGDCGGRPELPDSGIPTHKPRPARLLLIGRRMDRLDPFLIHTLHTNASRMKCHASRYACLCRWLLGAKKTAPPVLNAVQPSPRRVVFEVRAYSPAQQRAFLWLDLCECLPYLLLSLSCPSSLRGSDAWRPLILWSA